MSAGRALLRSIVIVAVVTLALVLVVEAGLRVALAIAHGGSRYYLLYGLHGWTGRVDISPWSTFSGEHYTFPPRYVLHGAAGQGEETASINALGFRGPDFEPRKPRGVFRVVCLGGSSTFGFHNRDTGTYPVLLQQLLDRRDVSGRVEVINAGFPYYNTGSILSLLKAQVLGWEPDVITVYSAFNDAGWPLEIGPGLRALLWLQQRSATYLFLKEHVATDRRVMALSRRLDRYLPGHVDEAAVERHIERVAARYRRDLEEIVALAEAAGARVILARQPMRVGSRHDRRYEEQYRGVRAKLKAGRRPSSRDLVLLAHHRLIGELDAFSQAHGLHEVDNIAIVDARPDRLATWVHLTEEGNQRLAEALGTAIRPVLADVLAPGTRRALPAAAAIVVPWP